MDPNAPFTVVKESPALALVGAHNGSGTVVAVKAMPMAIAKAKVCGVGMAVVRHSTQRFSQPPFKPAARVVRTTSHSAAPTCDSGIDAICDVVSGA